MCVPVFVAVVQVCELLLSNLNNLSFCCILFLSLNIDINGDHFLDKTNSVLMLIEFYCACSTASSNVRLLDGWKSCCTSGY